MLAIVPVRGRDGKQRLRVLLAPEERARLVEAMLADVLAACAAATRIESTLVVTPEPALAPAGVAVLEDEGAGHAAAIERALADGRAAAGAVVVMGDCPLVTPAALDALVDAASPVALAPAADGGVNAIALLSPGAVEPAFAHPDAAAATIERARAAGLEARVLDDPALRFDVDHPPDVWKLRESRASSRARDELLSILPATAGLL